MSGSKLLMIIGILCVVSFLATFMLTLWTAEAPLPQEGETAGAAVELARIEALTPRQSMLEDLIRDVRAKSEMLARRERLVNEQEERLKIAHQQLVADADRLKALHAELLAPLANLKEALAALERSRILIAREETANLKKNAKICGKMPNNGGSAVMIAMCKEDRFEDAAKLLYYMPDRNAQEVLAQIAAEDAALACKLLERMKTIREEG